MKTDTNKNNTKDTLYVLTQGRTPLTYAIPAGQNFNLLRYDSETKMNLPIRHCPGEESIFVKKQSDHALCSPIIFKDGSLLVRSTDGITKEFLDKHPKNSANGGNLFEVVDKEANAKRDNKHEDRVIDAKAEVRKLSKLKEAKQHLIPVCAIIKESLSEVEELSIPELTTILYRAVDTKVGFFLNDKGDVTIFEDKYVKNHYLTLKAIQAGIIITSPDQRVMLWADNNEEITTTPVGQDLIQTFAEFLSTKNGAQVKIKIVKDM